MTSQIKYVNSRKSGPLGKTDPDPPTGKFLMNGTAIPLSKHSSLAAPMRTIVLKVELSDSINRKHSYSETLLLANDVCAISLLSP